MTDYNLLAPNDWIESTTVSNERVITTADTRSFDGIELNPTAEDQAIPVIYGYRRVIPPRIFAAVKTTNTKILYVAYALGEGKIARMDKLFIDDNQVSLPVNIQPYTVYTVNYQGETANVQWEYSLGDPSSNPSTTLIGEITGRATDYAGFTDSCLGVAYIIMKFTYSGESSPFKDIPKITIDLFGRTLRANPSASTETELGGTNPADVLLDYMTNTRYGCSISSSRIDSTSLADIKSYFNETIIYYTNGPAQKKFTCNYILDTSRNSLDNVKEICRQFLIIMHYTNGRFRFEVEKAGTYGVAIDDSVIVGGITETYPDLTTKVNTVIVNYPEPYFDYRPTAVTYQDATALAADGRLLTITVDADAITNFYEAQAIARTIFNKTRNQRTYRFQLVKNAMRFSVGDIIRIDATPDLMPNGQVVRIIELAMNEDYTYSVTAVSHDDGYYIPFTPGRKQNFIDKLQPVPGGLTPPAIGTVLTPVVSDPPPEVPIAITPAPVASATVSRFTLSFTGGRPPTLTGGEGSDWYMGAVTPSGLYATYQHSLDLDRGNFGIRQKLDLFKATGVTSTLVAVWQPHLTYRWRNSSEDPARQGKFEDYDDIFMTYKIGNLGHGTQSATNKDANVLTPILFDPEQPDVKPRILVNGLYRIFDLNDSFCLNGNVLTGFTGFPRLTFDPSSGIYITSRTFALTAPYNTTGKGLDSSGYSRTFVLDDTTYRQALSALDTTPVAPAALLEIKFFVPVKGAAIVRYLGKTTLNMKLQRIADKIDLAGTKSDKFLATSRRNWVEIYGGTAPF